MSGNDVNGDSIKFNKLEKQYVALDNKLEQETVVANAEKWKKIVSYVGTAIVGAIIAFVLAKIALPQEKE